MRNLIFLIVLIACQGCFGPTKLDASNTKSIEKSKSEMAAELSEQEQKKAFKEAMQYFSASNGGIRKVGEIAKEETTESKLSESENRYLTSYNTLEGMTVSQIIEKYQTDSALEEKILKSRESIRAALAVGKFEESEIEIEIDKLPSVYSGSINAEYIKKQLKDELKNAVVISKIEMIDTTVKVMDKLGVKVVVFKTTLKNGSDVTLKSVVPIIQLYNSDGLLVKEQKIFDFYDEGKLIRPGEIVSMKLEPEEFKFIDVSPDAIDLNKTNFIFDYVRY